MTDGNEWSNTGLNLIDFSVQFNVEWNDVNTNGFFSRTSMATDGVNSYQYPAIDTTKLNTDEVFGYPYVNPLEEISEKSQKIKEPTNIRKRKLILD